MADLKSKQGTTLSKAAVDKLAAEAEAGYDLSNATRQRVRPGRPSLSEANRRGSATEWRQPYSIVPRRRRRRRVER
jgi:hypothetical protein